MTLYYYPSDEVYLLHDHLLYFVPCVLLGTYLTYLKFFTLTWSFTAILDLKQYGISMSFSRLKYMQF